MTDTVPAGNHRMWHKLASIALLAAIGVFLFTAFSAIAAGPWYVSPQGSGEDCTAGNPCGSIQLAVSKASAGEMVKVAEGTYTETVVITKSVILEGGYESGGWTRNITQYETTINADGAGSVISVTMGCTPTIDGFTITGGTGFTKTTFTRGGGVFIDKAAGTLRDNTIYDNTAWRGGGIVVYRATDVVTIQGGKVISNVATDFGGGVRIFNSQVELLGVEVRDNRSSVGGGGLYISTNAAVTMTQLSATGNRSATHGGGLYVSTGSATISNSTFISNTLYAVDNSNGGGIYAIGVASLHLENVEARHNQAYRGGGIYYNGTSGQIVNATIVSNTAGLGGGGLYLNGASPSIEGGEVSLNQATDITLGRGGGIYAVSGLTPATVNISGTRILSNTTPATSSSHRGGGIFVYSSTVMLLTNVSVEGNSSYDGGGIHIREGVSMTVRGSTASANTAANAGGGFHNRDASLTVRDSTTSANTAIQAGGGFYNRYASLTAYGGQISRNTVLTPTTGPGGGGILVSSGSLGVSGTAVMTNTVFTSSGFGGGIHVTDASNATITGGQIAGNSAQVGGGVRTSLNATLSLDSTEVRENEAVFGAGVYVNTSPSSVISNATVVSNTATGYASGLYIYDAAVAVNGGRFSLNDGAAKGGGMYILNSTGVTLTGVSVLANSASSGGGVYIEASSPSLIALNVVSNTAASSGGGVFSLNSSPSFEGGEVSNNRVTDAVNGTGGGLYIDGGVPTLDGTTVMSNSTPTQSDFNRGGGIFLQNITSPATWSQLRIQGNRSRWGAGAYVDDSAWPLTMNGGQILDNKGAYVGGGMRSRNIEVNMNGVTVSSNSATYGGGVAVYRDSGQHTVTISDCTFADNTANLWGGAMHLWNLPVTVRNSDIRSNAVISASEGLAGGLFVRGATATVISNTLAENRAGAAGAEAGAVKVTAYSSTPGELALDANTISVDPSGGTTCGGVCVDTGSRLTATNNLMFNNSALRTIQVNDTTSQARIINNTLIGSKSGDTGIAVTDATATVRNNIVVSHTTGIVGSGSFAAILANNDVWTNTLDYSGLTPGSGDISLDPEFVSASDYHLTSTSPCINAGTWADAPPTDHDGQPRSDCVVDIGAYESAEGKSRCTDVYLPAIMKNY